MKKIILLLVALILSLTVLTSCEMLYEIIGVIVDNGHVDEGGSGENKEPDGGNGSVRDDTPDDGSDETPDGGKDESKHRYNSFTYDERALLLEIAGGVIPFVPNDEYYVEEYYDEYYEEVCVNYYTYGNTKAEFEAYKALFSDYELVETYEDDYGDSWYCFDGETYVEMCYYYYDGEYVIDVYVYVAVADDDGGDSGNQGGNEGGGYRYTAFTSDERALLLEIAGGVIPFVPNGEYYVEEYYDEYYEELCVNYYTYGNTKAEFEAYKALFSDYELVETYEDDYGDSWYCLEGDTYVEMCYYYYDGEYVIDVYVYSATDGGNGESGGSGGNIDADIITNAGAGLPDGTNGVYDIDFTDATYVKDVTDQGNYLDGCPTVGSPKVLVIPVDFKDINGRYNGCSINNIVRAFSGGAGETDYYSVHDYYYISSYGKLDIDVTVVNEWFVPKYNSSYYENATMDYYGDEVAIGDQMVMDEALAYLAKTMDLSSFDSDGNSIIDAVVLVTTLEIDDSTDFNWAYRYWNIYTDEDGYYYEYDGVSANDYLWAPYSFMHESYDEDGYVYYTDTSVMNTYTYIHEFGHILGADDYYNTAERGEHPMDGCDIMDSMNGDHNAFTKFNLGWLTTSRLVTTSTSVRLTLDDFTRTGDSIIIANNWDDRLGAYQEYYIVVYYTSEGLNSGEGGYFSRDGIVVYHINASLYSDEYDGEIYYDIYNNNTDPSDEYGTEDNLIEFVKSSEGNYTYVEGDSLPTVTDDQGNRLGYTFTVESIDADSATITFTKK